MDPDTVSLVDILLPPGTSTERTLGKFRPKPRPKTVKPSPTPSRSLDGTQLIRPTLEPPSHAPDLKCPEEKLNLPSSLIDGSFTNASDLDVIQESVNQPVASHAERLISDNDNVVSLQCDQRESGEADMFSSMESLDFLKPPSTSVRAVGIFQPKAKAQSKGKILLRTSTGVPDGEKSVGASNNSSSSSASEAISSELHLTRETCLTEETMVLVGVSADKSQVSDSDASLQIDPDKSEHEAMTVVSCLESLGDGIFLSNSTAEQAPGKFHPKLRPKTVKQISACSVSADASHLISPFLEPLLHASDVKCPEKGQGLPTICTTGTSTTCTSELHISLESANQMEASHSEDLVFNGDKKETSKLDKENLKGLQMPDMFSSMESLQVDSHPALTTSSLTTGVVESLDALDISASSFPPVAISSKLHINQEPLSIIEEQVTSVEASQDRHEVSESCVNLHPHSDKPGAEATEMFSGIESSGDVFFQPSTSAVKPVGKFQPKLIPQPKRAKAKKISFILPDAAESVAPPVDSNTSSSQNEGTEMLACNSTGVEPSFLHMLGEGSLDDTPHSSFTFSDCNGDIQMGHEKSEEEDTTELTGIESLENILSQPMSTTGESQGKFQPKLSARVKIVKPTIPVTIHGVLEPLNSHDDSSPTDNSIFDVASPGSINILLERDNSVVGKAKSSSASKDISKEVQSQDVELTQQILVDRSTSKAVEDDGACKSSRKLRKRISLCSPSGDDKTNDDWDFDDNISQNDEVQNDEEYSGEEVPKQKRAPRKSKRQMTENEKPVRKSNKASEIAVRKPVKKKFPHGTQRKRRQVNKELLEAFEDEHDRKQLSLKVLIMIGEDKERIVSKEAAALKKTSSNQSSSLPNGTHFDTDNPLGDEHHLNSDGDEANRNIELSSRKLNYHSFMEGRSARWSKSDTEKFYQAIRQFGTDFSLIQKLFPQRTRQQIKLKFKNEERKHRSQVNDALVHRTKDHSHFELMILKLQEEAEQNAYKEATDDPVTASQDGENENEEERGGPDKAEETNDWEGGAQSPGKFDEDGGGYQWDANPSSPRDMEKDSYNYL